MKQPVFNLYLKFFYFVTTFKKVRKIIPHSDSIIKKGNHKLFQTLKWCSHKATVPCVIIVVNLTLQKFMFINFIADIDKNLENSISRLFANDTKVSAKIKSQDDTERFQQDINKTYT